MTGSPDEPVRSGRLAAILAVFLVPGGAAALVLWHEVINYVLVGRPPRVSIWIVLASVAVMGAVIAALARFIRGLDGGASR
jgi:hypothetical protein